MRIQRVLRSLVLAIGSIALVGVLFMVYAYSEGDLGRNRSVYTVTPTPAPTAPPLAEGTPPSEMRVGKEQIPVAGGEHVRHVIYDEDGKVRGEIELARWQPVGERRNEFEVTNPVIRLRSPSGQVIRITGESGWLVTRSSDPRSFDPRSGRLVGNVHIILDRLTDEERAALPPEQRDIITPKRLVEMRMQDLHFDLEFARVETAGDFTIEADEVSFAGTGLSLDYNEVDGRIEELIVTRKGRIELRGMGRVFGLGTTGNGKAEAPAAPKAENVSSRPKSPKPTPTPSGLHPNVPILTLDAPPRPHRPRPLDAYTATFDGAVRILQYEGDAEAGQMLAEQLEILFDFGQRERELTRRSTDADTSGVAADGAAPAGPPSRIHVTWTGPLRVISQRLPVTATPEPGKRSGRIHLVAVGAPVSISDAERSAACDKLIYHDETGFVQLFGTSASPALVRGKGGSELRGAFIELNRREGTARAEGPAGRLVAAKAASLASLSDSADAPLTIRFEQSFEATFARKETSSNGLEQDGDLLNALRSAVFVGDVRVQHGRDRIQCARMEMDFAPDPTGRPQPAQARMFKDVRVSQGARMIAAREQLLTLFRVIEREKPPFDLAQARARAAARGLDPDQQDWAARQKEYEARRVYGTVLGRVDADGGIEVRDPDDQVEITGQSLDCRLRDDGTIEAAIVRPDDDGQAFVAMGDFSIAAPVPIPFASGTQALRVSGPGRMTFPSSQDFDGRELDRPVLVTVRWSERMDFAGKDNRADFLGAVHVETPDSTYDCSALRVDFRDAVRKPAQPTAMERIDWWLFEPLVDRWQRPDERRWRAGGDDAFDKEPIRFFALGGVKAINRNVDPRDRKLRSRVLITGPQMSVDLEQHVVQVDGSGSLLIEDYRPATRKIPSQVTTAPAGEEGVISPLGRWSTSGSSQTYVAWEGLMNYRYRDNVARFERDVTLVHSKGAKMKLAPTQGASEGGAGQESHLNCAKLTVEFEQRDASAPSGRRAGTSRLSGNEVRNFTAEGKVYVHDSGVTAIARTITYSRADNLLQILGTETDPAQIYDEREGRPGTITGSRIVWDMATNKIWVPQSRARMN